MAVITHASLETDLRLAAVLDQEIALKLADRSSIRNTGALKSYGLINGRGSDTLTIRIAGLDGSDKFAVTAAEDTDVSDTSLTDASVSLAVARYSLRRDLGDLAELTGFPGSDISVDRLAASMVGEAEQCFMELVGNAITGFGDDKGSKSTNLSVDNWFDAIAFLQTAGNTGSTYALLNPAQLGQLQSSVRAEAGAIQFVPATQDLLAIKGAGYAGSFAGVDVYTSTQCESSGGGYDGAMWAQGCIGYAEAAPMISMGATQRPAASPVVVEFQRDASKALTEIIGHYYCGVAVIQDDMGVGLLSTD
jgi:hypothetical protein